MDSERGDVILSGLLRLVAGLLLFALLAYEVCAVGVNVFQVDGLAQDGAVAAALVWRQDGGQTALETAVSDAVEGRGGRVDAVASDAESVSVTVSRPAPVLFIDRVGFLAQRLVATATKTRIMRP